MNVQQTLEDVGLSQGESKVYLALLKLGAVQVNKLKEETKLHRTTIYDFLEKLLNKGLINYVIKSNVKFYSATDTNKLLEFIKEKEDQIKDVLPELKRISTTHSQEMRVEVYKGVEGVKTILNDILRVGKDYVIFGIDETMFKDKIGAFMDHFFRKERQLGFKERILTTDEASYVYAYDTALYRYLSKESFNPTPTYVYGNNVAILIWEPFTVIKIENKALADSYGKYFEILWKIAKRKPKSAVLKNR